MKRLLAASIGCILFTAAGVAAASNFASDRQSDYFARGTHRFYVWCAGGNDYSTSREGASAEDAQLNLYSSLKLAGKKNCWPVWQGRVATR
jgi:uncharacterized protein YfiM (DUF2279 family)